MLNHLANHQITHLNAETKIQALIMALLAFWVVFTVSSFVGNPVYAYFLLFLTLALSGVNQLKKYNGSECAAPFQIKI